MKLVKSSRSYLKRLIDGYGRRRDGEGATIVRFDENTVQNSNLVVLIHLKNVRLIT